MNYRVLVYNSELSNPYSDLTYILGIEFSSKEGIWESLPRLHANIRESADSIIHWCSNNASGSTNLCVDPDKDSRDFVSIVFYLGKGNRAKVYKWFDRTEENNVSGSRVIYDSELDDAQNLCGRDLVAFVDKHRETLMNENPDILSNLSGNLENIYSIGFNDSLDIVIGRGCP